MDWDKLRIFYVVASAKSLTKAGEQLHLSQSAVSRQISALEERIGLPLFHRHARGLLLSEQGEILFRTVSDMVSKLQATESALADSTSKPKGPFKLTAPIDLGVLFLTPLLREFSELYPEIEVTLALEDRELDLTKREADAAIRFAPAKQLDLVQKPLIELHNSLYASNDYLREHGIPKNVDDLVHHRVIAFHGQGPFREVNWLLEHPRVKPLKVKPALHVNSLQAMRTAVKQGMGIAALPDYMLARGRHMSRVLDDLDSPVTQAYFVYPMELKNSKRVSAFRGFIERKLSEAAL